MIGLPIVAVVGILAIFLLENAHHQNNQRYTLRDAFSFVMGFLFGRDMGGVVPRRLPGKLVSSVFAFGMAILVSAFTAQLTATSIVEIEEDFQGLKDPVFQDPSYTFGVIEMTAHENYVDTLNLKAKKIRFDDSSAGIQSVYNKSIDAFMDESYELVHVMNMNKRYKNEMRLINEPGISRDVAFATQKGSYVNVQVSAFLRRITENGDLKRISDGWGITKTSWKKKDGDSSTHFNRIPLKYGLSLALILGCASIFCVFILPVENFVVRFKAKKKIRTKSTIREIELDN